VGHVWQPDSIDDARILNQADIGAVKSLAFGEGGNSVIAGGDSRVVLMGLATGKETPLRDSRLAGSVWDVALDDTGTTAVTPSLQGALLFWDDLHGTPKAVAPANPYAPVWSVDVAPLHPDLVVTAHADGWARIWNRQSSGAAPIMQLEFRATDNPQLAAGLVWTARFSHDDRLLVTTGDGTAQIWELQGSNQPRLVTRVTGHAGPVYDARFSPNDELLVTAGDDSTARVWDWRKAPETPLHTLHGHAGRLSSAQFSADGAWILTGGEDGTARVWDPKSGDQVAVLHGHRGAVWTTAFSPAGSNAVITGGEGGKVRLFPMSILGDQDQIAALVRRRIGQRQLTAEECSRYLVAPCPTAVGQTASAVVPE
jgi:WD40 repeat protein